MPHQPTLAVWFASFFVALHCLLNFLVGLLEVGLGAVEWAYPPPNALTPLIDPCFAARSRSEASFFALRSSAWKSMSSERRMRTSRGASMAMRTLLPSISQTVMVMLLPITIFSPGLRDRTSIRILREGWSGFVHPT